MITDKKLFNFKDINGNDIRVDCETYEYSRGWGHRATLVWVGDNWYNFTKRKTYYNRTYESFKYESVLYSLFESFYNRKADKDNLDYLCAQLKDYANNERKEAEKWLKAFESRYNALSDNTKAHLKNADITLENKEQAESILKLSEAFDLLLN